MIIRTQYLANLAMLLEELHGCGRHQESQPLSYFQGYRLRQWGSIRQGRALIFYNNTGICRPLTAAVAAAGRGKFVLDGVKRMRERPIQDLVDGLTALGVDVKCTLGTGCPPVEVNASGLPTGKVQ